MKYKQSLIEQLILNNLQLHTSNEVVFSRAKVSPKTMEARQQAAQALFKV